MVDAAPGDVGDVQQAVDAAEVDERSVLGEVLDDAAQDLALFELRQRLLLLCRVLDLEDRLARQHDVAAALVDLDHAHAELLADQALQVAHRPDVDQRAGQERGQTDVDLQPALDAVDHAADDRLAGLVGLLDDVPDLEPLGLLLGQHDVAVAVLGLLEQDVDLVADLDVGSRRRRPRNSSMSITPSDL